MKMKIHHLIVGGIAALLVILSGCGHPQSSQHSTTETSSKRAAQSATTKSARQSDNDSSKSSHKKAALWSPSKSNRLASFMKDWGNTMGQDYAEYSEAHPLNYYGLKVPTELSKMPPAVNNAKISYTLSNDGSTTADYAIVAIYSDEANGDFMGEHLYLFTLHHGEPEVLVTMQDQGTSTDWLYFHQTENKDLQNGFAQIVAGNPAHSPATNSSTDSQTANVDAKTAGILLLLYHDSEWLKTYIDSTMWYGTVTSTDDGGDEIPSGYNYITAHGDPTSYVYYSVSGDIITYKYIDATGDKPVSESPLVTKTISLKRLENDYYTTAAQKREVDGYAAKLQSDKGSW